MSTSTQGPEAVKTFDAVIVGAGFSGLYMLHRLRGLGLTARVIEAGSGVGGTWFWNRYPGARVDIESQEYSFAFDEALEREWKWTERYAPQPELLKYANHVADRYDLRRDIDFNTRVIEAAFDEPASRWTVRTDKGDVISARYCIMATGCLSLPNEPKFKGQERFKGATYHTGRWPHEPVDFTGKTVGVIGTGSSAIQSIPVIASQARHVYVFQRTPNYSVPAHNAPIDENVVAEWQANRDANRAAQRMSPGGFTYHDPRERLVSEASPEEHKSEFEARWARGGFAMLGAFLSLFIARGLGIEAVGWLMIHGVTELFAVTLAGAAGFGIGWASLFPGQASRMDAIMAAGRRGALVMVGVVVMLFVAGLLEGFARQLIQDTGARLTIAAATALLWGLYFYVRRPGLEP